MIFRKTAFLLIAFMAGVLTAVGNECGTAAAGKFTLVIDAGHGGHDHGAPGAFSKEKNINLNVALAFGRYVERNCPDVKVIYTRKTDVFIPLRTRAEIANKNKADVFISIHTNAVPGRSRIRGLETYTMGLRRSDEKLSAAMRENEVILYENDYRQHYQGYDPRSPESLIMFEIINDKNMSESVELAKLIQEYTCATAGRPNKGVKQDVFLVLRETSMPACLVELGYISTPDEERYLNNKANVEAMGRGIYQAFVAYKNRVQNKITVPYKPKRPAERNVSPTPSKEEEAANNASQQQTTETVKEKEPAKPEESAKVAEKKNVSTAVKDAEPKKTAENETQADSSKTAEPAKVPESEITAEPVKAAVHTGRPVFKVQVLVSSSRLKPNDRQFKGLSGLDCYEENNLYKYTVGSSENYNEIYRLRKSVLDRFPQAFIIAFKDGAKTDVVEAVKEFKANRQKK